MSKVCEKKPLDFDRSPALRNMNRKVAVSPPKTEFIKKCLTFNGSKFWNSLPNDVRSCETLASFNNLTSSLGPFSNH